MKPFPNRTSAFQRIRLSIARELSPGLRLTISITRKPILNPGGIATVALRPVIGFTVSLGGHYSTDYYGPSAPTCGIGHSANLSSIKRKSQISSGVARIAIYASS
jgi:hypothetical protein